MATGRVPTTANSPLTTKGDLFGYSTAPARLAVGSNGDTIVADSSTSTGLRYQTGVSLNGVINGAMDIWQRGTSFASTGNIIYTADRWASFRAAVGLTVTRQTASLEGFQYSLRAQRDSGNTSTATNYIFYSMETSDSVRYANKAVTLSFWARAGANYSSASSALTVQWTTGTGTDQTIINGYTGANNIISTTATLTTSWQRFTYTGTAPSNTNEMGVLFANVPVGTAGANDWFEVTGVQVELGSVATNFKRAGGGTIQGETSACQRYYVRETASSGYGFAVFAPAGLTSSTTRLIAYTTFPVQMRTVPSSVEYGGNLTVSTTAGGQTVTSIALSDRSSDKIASVNYNVASGLTTSTYGFVRAENDATAYVGFSAEL